MKRQEAERFIGKTVACWTALRGSYIGTLIEITNHRPWRGKVRILAITEYPVQGLSNYSAGFKMRKPAGFGDVWEFGNSSIVPYDGDVPDYRESLVCALRKSINKLEIAIALGNKIGKKDVLLERWLDVLRERLQELLFYTASPAKKVAQIEDFYEGKGVDVK